MRAGASPRSLAGALFCLLAASSGPARPESLPEMASVRSLDCVDGGSEIYVSGRHLGKGTSGWTVELAGVPLEIREWRDDRILAHVPDAIRERPASERPDLTLRSQQGGVLSRLLHAVRLCGDVAPTSPGPRPDGAPAVEAIAGASPGGGPSGTTRGAAPVTAPPSRDAGSAVLGARPSMLPGELLVGVPDRATADAIEAAARQLGQRDVARRSELDSLGYVVVRLRFADPAAAQRAAQALRELYPTASIENNDVYHREAFSSAPLRSSASSPRSFAKRGVHGRAGFSSAPAKRPWARASAQRSRVLASPGNGGWPRANVQWPLRPSCGQGRRVGIVDTCIDAMHPELAGQRVISDCALGDSEAPARARAHGTAVASLLVGRSLGLVPYAELYDAAVFWEQDQQIVSSAEAVVRGIAWLVEQRVDVINLSLTGPENRVVADALRSARAQGIALVAAAGNDGPQAPVAFPASLADVLAVTAVDARNIVYARASRGKVDLAAPGVDVQVAGGEGAPAGLELASGTSYAVPFVTAALALEQRGLRALLERAEDLGSPGKDDTYGYGLLQAGGLCPGEDGD